MGIAIGTYKGKKYRVEFLGQTKFGRRAKLAFFSGGKSFWVDASAVSLAEPTARAGYSGVRPRSQKATPPAPVFTEQAHRVDSYGELCGCGSDACSCQKCGRRVCGTQTKWAAGTGNVCTACTAKTAADTAAELAKLDAIIADMEELANRYDDEFYQDHERYEDGVLS